MLTNGGHLMAAVDIETTGLLLGHNEIIQVCILPLDDNLEEDKDRCPFYMNVRPEYPERACKKAMQVNGLNLDLLSSASSSEETIDYLYDWRDSLGMNPGMKIIPLTQNAPFDIPFMKLWIGSEGFDDIFTRRGRDTMFTALSVNDRAAWKARPIPFPSVGLSALCEYFGIELNNHHDARADCQATAKVYKELLRMQL